MTLTRRHFLSLAASSIAATVSCNTLAGNILPPNIPHGKTEMPLTTAELLMHTTVRLEGRLKDGRTSTGTGFFFSFKINDQTEIPVIVTNKHVIHDVERGTFVLTKRNDKDEPLVGSSERIVVDDFERRWFKHPDQNVDLAVFPIAGLYKQANAQGIKFFTPPLQETLLPTDEQLASLSGMDNITMIGYPDGIWDEKNNMPIARHGITATNPKYDYNGLPIFVIDCACFPGSSGSPVLIFDRNGYADAKGNIIMGSQRIILLGVLFAGPQHDAVGEIRTIEVPLSNAPIILSKIPNNLGFVVKSAKIADFRQILIANG